MVGMEGAVVSGMLNILAKKLAPLVIKQYSSIVGVTKDLQDLQVLVQEINFCLEKAGDKAMGSGWLRQLKDVLYDVVDIVDEFHLEAEKHETGGSKHTVSKYLYSKPKSFLFQCKAARKIKAIKQRFAAIVKQRTDFSAIVNSLPDGHPFPHINRTARAIPSLVIVDESSVRGRDQEKHEIISKLVDTNNQEIIKIVSIFGLGGCGKTTLAKLIFNDEKFIKKYFEVRIWVHVSQEFDVEKLAKKLFEAISREKSEAVTDKSTGKRYLLVLDDVWTEDRLKWEEFMVHVKNGALGSSILLTTRNKKVAEAVDSTDTFNLRLLSEVDSWAVFSQSLGIALKGLDSEFLEIGKEIVSKCGGVPLAIKVLAGVLHDKRRIEEWKAMRDSNLLDIEDKENRVSACLKLSYFHLPSHLKQCFTICSLIPKGHLIYKEQLIDQWIAHNMIHLSIGADYLEDIGDECFNSLVQVSFLQDVDEYNGRVICKMHDLVHDLARSIMREEISTNVPKDAGSSTKGYRYFSLIEHPKKLFPKRVFDNARAIYVDKVGGITFGKALKNAKHLRSIIVEDPILSKAALMSIFQVKYLKYLEISQLQCEALPETISDIWSLEAIYLTSGDVLKLPKSIGKLKKLRTLNLSWCSMLKCLPDSIGDCHMLSTLDLTCCFAFEELPDSIGRNKRLRVLRLVSTRICMLPSSITSLENLEYLKLKKCKERVELPEGIGHLTKLKTLDLDDYIVMPPGIGQLTRLEKLSLFCVEFDKKYARISELATLSRISGKLSICFLRCLTDPNDSRQAWLKQKEKLHDLELSWWSSLHSRVDAEHEVDVLAGLEPPLGIKRLKISAYGGERLAWWMIKQASGGVQGLCQFPFLTKMVLCGFPNLKHLDGLVQLPSLEKLHLKDMPALESISGGPFPSLVKLKLNGMHRLGEVWMVADMTLSGREEGEGRSSSSHDPYQFGQVQIGSRLKSLDIRRCPKLEVKPYFPTSLERLELNKSNSNLLLSPCQGQGSSSSSNSSPSFNHLKVLILWCIEASSSPPPPPGLIYGCRLELLKHMSALESLEIFSCNDLAELPECLGELCSLKRMRILDCASLNRLPQSIRHLTSLQEFEIEMCDALVQFPQGLTEVRSLCKLKIFHLWGLNCLPQSFCRLTSLKELNIGDCKALAHLPDGLGELCSLRKLDIWRLPGLTCLPQSLCCIMSLQELHIGGCDALCELPERLGELCCLRKLKIRDLRGLTCLPQSLCRLTTSLEEIMISSCWGIQTLPEWMEGLTALQRLEIHGCPNLEWRCRRGRGEDWHLISHIPHIWIEDLDG